MKKLAKKLFSPRNLLIAIVCLFSASSIAQASEIDIVITSSGTNSVIFDIEYEISGTILASAFDAMDPATGATTDFSPYGTVGYQSWFDLGDVFDPKYGGGFDSAFFHGFNGVVSSDPNLGIAADQDGGGLDDLYLVATSTSYLASLQGTSGSFTLTLPTGIDCFRPGNFVSNDGMGRISVVPEPSSTMVVLSAALFVACGSRRRRVTAGDLRTE
jgi:hypothetical protein